MAQFSLCYLLFHLTHLTIILNPVITVLSAEAEYDPYKDFVLVGGKLDRKCDPSFHDKYATPIYATNDAASFKKAVHTWGDALISKKKQKETCFGVYEDPVDGSESFTHFNCDKKTKKCACHSTGPMKQTRNKDQCQLVESEVGSLCDFVKMTELNEGPEIALHNFYNKTTNMKDLVWQKQKGPLNSIFFNHLMSILDFISRPWGRSGVCQTVDRNLECLQNNKCGCLNVAPWFQYKASGKKCVGIQDSICELTIAHYMDAKGQLHYVTVRKADCDQGLECQEVTTAFEKYTIKTCGGTIWPESARA